ncbi:hypothetical protein EVAR_68696_1 [Eumeta japonica]|uniref:Uncharacterized protein n=1 Tax=Eumeta variegata TaxID=151549 RepID=A0A4C2A2N4_EUMVA|nr:hypothetical protein EVAR_68696_1 [Eumeta japonica]
MPTRCLQRRLLAYSNKLPDATGKRANLSALCFCCTRNGIQFYLLEQSYFFAHYFVRAQNKRENREIPPRGAADCGRRPAPARAEEPPTATDANRPFPRSVRAARRPPPAARRPPPAARRPPPKGATEALPPSSASGAR